MMFYDVLWCSMMFYDVIWCSMMFYDVFWCFMMFYVLRAFLVSFCGSLPLEFLRSFLVINRQKFRANVFFKNWAWQANFFHPMLLHLPTTVNCFCKHYGQENTAIFCFSLPPSPSCPPLLVAFSTWDWFIPRSKSQSTSPSTKVRSGLDRYHICRI